ncbi:LysR family transcriptional regulator [Alcaligenes endophyticus]|uniref:LysR family transcriptional regulator n=1 Tax=Alcaligenes endophyticus TaxID=1929088 RepID=A0ABT8EMQ8_9BURK|nr:LysR family transcriptional regulator [Alcaligenes endophyticus]MCX5591540.1 LysR family transcriptional regulator [Alcaligenes endophyticus]MDN4122579.1 LysR family transcriptional regulator [Alcaligenes endophyticus]
MKTNRPLSQVTDFDLRLLRVFKAVAQVGSFAAAESILGISRSAISLHMKDLEKRLGIRLCQRGRAGFALTDEGRTVLQAIDTLLMAVGDFRNEINQLHQSLRGTLNIGIINNLVTEHRMHVTEALRALRAQSNQIHINISMSTPEDIELGLLDGRLHAGVIPFIQPLQGLKYLPLYEEPHHLYCSDQHPLFAQAQHINPAELRGVASVVPSYRLPAETFELLQQLEQAATATDREGIAFLILTGDYVGFLPSHLAQTWVEQDKMRALAPQHMHFALPLAVAVRQAGRQNLLIDAFLEALTAY